jgi:PIN domain nuclease of toxin-antitoxin system
VRALHGLPPWQRDPFDHMLVAQAIIEALRLLTHDAALAA